MNTYGPLFDKYGVEKLDRGVVRTPSIATVNVSATNGQQLKEKGIKLVSEHNENWMERALQDATVYAFNQTVVRFTGEDLRLWCQARIGFPTHPNAWGALINTLIRRKIIVPTGEHRKMKDSRSHARSTPVYKSR